MTELDRSIDIDDLVKMQDDRDYWTSLVNLATELLVIILLYTCQYEI